MNKIIFTSLLIPVFFSSCGTIDAVKNTAVKATQSVKQTASNATQSVKETTSSATQSVKQSASNATHSVKQTASNATRSVKDFSLSSLGLSRIDVVEVREKDLKEMPLGKERALAYERKRDESFWSFMLKDYKEPALPDIEEAELDGLLLPPKS